MKKIFSIISCLMLMVILISGCSCSNNKAKMLIGDINATSYIDLNSFENVESMIENKESFILFVYQDRCPACARFKPILQSVIKERHLNVYGIEYIDIDSDHELANLEYTPSLVVYKNGEVLVKAEPVGKKLKYFEDKNGLSKFMDKYVVSPIAYYININQLREKINNKESFIIYYSYSECPDCGYLNRNYLKEYLNEYNGNKKLYILETGDEGVRINNGEYDGEQWQSIKDELGLSKAGNAEFGYETGVVPTFQYYKDGELKGMMVYANDKMENIEGTDSDIKITSSYYEDNPFIGQTMNYYDYHDTVAGFFNGKLKSFLDTNLPLVD